MDWVTAIAVFIGVAWYLVKREEPAPKSDDYQGGHRVGRAALWAVCPPLGFWRSANHKAEQRNQRLIDEIRKAKANDGKG